MAAHATKLWRARALRCPSCTPTASEPTCRCIRPFWLIRRSVRAATTSTISSIGWLHGWLRNDDVRPTADQPPRNDRLAVRGTRHVRPAAPAAHLDPGYDGREVVRNSRGNSPHHQPDADLRDASPRPELPDL